jgi:hypothetical protein
MTPWAERVFKIRILKRTTLPGTPIDTAMKVCPKIAISSHVS